ncbi:MAG: ComF family protein [Clostridia bacterium]|nr:ComF family protein [Clostridia bacterium]
MRKFKKAITKTICKSGEIGADILCPKKCIMCNCLTPIGKKEAVCSDCEKKIKSQSAVVVEPDSYFEEAIGAIPYEGFARKSMIRFKFEARKYLASAFGYCISRLIDGRDFLKDYNIMCPVPIHPGRGREYNQAALIAKYVCDRFDIELCENMLIKLKNLSPVSAMGYSLRRVSVVGCIDFNTQYDIFGKNILLLDDIYTTGSTANECSKILKMHGAANVIVLAACHNEKKGDEADGNATYFGF